MGATQTPCTMNYQAGVQLSSPKQIDLVTTVTIPPASAGYSAALRHQVSTCSCICSGIHTLQRRLLYTRAVVQAMRWFKG
jgi:hypothetical protein